MIKPTDIKLHQASHMLEVVFSDGKTFNLPVEYLRVNSPSAEVQGHGPGQEVLQFGKQDVNITQIEMVGNYAIQPFLMIITTLVFFHGIRCMNSVKTMTKTGQTTCSA